MYHACIRPYDQMVLNRYRIIAHIKQQPIESSNCNIFRIIYRWHDVTNNEIIHVASYKSIELLFHINVTKLLSRIICTNPTIITYYIQHRLYILFVREYFLHLTLLKEKQSIITKAKISNGLRQLLISYNPSFLDHTLDFTECS